MTVLSIPPPPRRPGRPRRPEPPPGPSAQVAEARRLAVLDELVEGDDLVVADRVDDAHLVDTAIRQLAVECAELGWQVRRARARRTAIVNKYSGQRIRALSRVAGLVLARVRSGLHVTDEPPEQLVEQVRELFLSEVSGVGVETVGEALTSELLQRVRGRLDGGTANGVRHEGEGEVEVQGRIPVDSGLGPA